MTDAPFFEPWPEPEVDEDSQQRDLDLPWLPPAHVAGVVVPLAADIHRGDDVVVRVTHVVAYQRGLELHVATWVRPGARRDVSTADEVWREHEPRIGVRLADGTRLGHRAPHAPPSPDQEASATRWLWHGSTRACPSRRWRSTSRRCVPKPGARRCSGSPPPPAEGDSFGWFAYAPMGARFP
jgi:hypothetical protein